MSPDFTLLTLLDFEPPPPILTNQRLPPLGALGQAPSPPAPLSRRHNRSLSPGSPTPLQRSSAFRPLAQRYNYMNRESKTLQHNNIYKSKLIYFFLFQIHWVIRMNHLTNNYILHTLLLL